MKTYKLRVLALLLKGKTHRNDLINIYFKFGTRLSDLGREGVRYEYNSETGFYKLKNIKEAKKYYKNAIKNN